MFDKIFVVGYNDDGGVVAVLNDLMNEEQTCKRKRTYLCLHRIFAEKESHKISIVLKLAVHNNHHHCSSQIISIQRTIMMMMTTEIYHSKSDLL